MARHDTFFDTPLMHQMPSGHEWELSQTNQERLRRSILSKETILDEDWRLNYDGDFDLPVEVEICAPRQTFLAE